MELSPPGRRINAIGQDDARLGANLEEGGQTFFQLAVVIHAHCLPSVPLIGAIGSALSESQEENAIAALMISRLEPC